MRDDILRAAVHLLAEGGLPACTVDRIAQAVPCAKGLINYHWRSKEQLLMEASGRLRTSREMAWSQAVADSQGAAALDALWQAIAAEVTGGRTGTRLALLGHPATAGVVRSSPSVGAQLAKSVAGALALPAKSVDPILLTAVLDGLELRLAGGEEPDRVRDAYDRFWLSVLTEESFQPETPRVARP